MSMDKYAVAETDPTEQKAVAMTKAAGIGIDQARILSTAKPEGDTWSSTNSKP